MVVKAQVVTRKKYHIRIHTHTHIHTHIHIHTQIAIEPQLVVKAEVCAYPESTILQSPMQAAKKSIGLALKHSASQPLRYFMGTCSLRLFKSTYV